MIARLPGGMELVYEEAGSGVPIVFLHGWPHDHTLWTAQVAGLATLARCIAPDLRGLGRSSVMPPFAIDQYADDVAALLDALHIDRAVVCGLSMGGYVAFSLLRRHRARLRGLVLADTRAAADSDEARQKRQRLVEFVEERGVEALARQQLRGMLAPGTFEARPDVREAVRRMMAAAPAEGVIGGLRAMMARRDSTDLLPTIDLPTLVVGGVDDGLTPPAELGAMAAAIPNARFELVADAGHLCPMEKPAAFNHLVGELLGRVLDG